ncbi:MAG: ferrous iron transport protein B, partial [Candidatus Hydrogenedentes bacterium]|nr:ferrous iron transport protein B [Candidatus Hydrogenedentota bacterium]
MPTAIAVVGNPNVGKTTLFNVLTGLSLKTGNYPGVTVERKTGVFRFGDSTIQLVDLPGTYSLAAHSPDEMLVVDVLLNQQRGETDVDAVLVVLDASNLERNLYLVSQLCELDKPIVVALNMMDVAQKRGIRIDIKRLSELISAPVIPVCATKRQGLDELRDALAGTARQRQRTPAAAVAFPSDLMTEVDGLSEDLAKHETELGRTVPHVEVFRILIDRNGYSEQRITDKLNGALAKELDERRTRATHGESLAAIESRSRYAWARQVTTACVTRPAHSGRTLSDRIDGILTHRAYGTIFLLFLMSVMFQAIFSWALPLMDLIDSTLGALGGFAGKVLPAGALQSLIVDGVIAGVGSVLIFLPQIIILSLFIAILEDCGYLSRAAYLMDRLLSRCGLSGHSFIPLLSSFACAIPGIMATRTIRSPRDRLATILVAPLMSCSARLPVYLVLIAAFVPHRPMLGGIVNLQGLTLLGMYSLGLVVAVPVSFLLKRTILRGKTPP